MPRGGKRKGSGRPKGPIRLEKEAAREIVRQHVFAHLQPLLEAQTANAQGLKYVVTRDKKTGKFERVTERLQELLEDESEGAPILEIWAKDPSIQAFTDLMNRALDKPKEQEQIINIRGDLTLEVTKRLNAARGRLQPRQS